MIANKASGDRKSVEDNEIPITERKLMPVGYTF